MAYVPVSGQWWSVLLLVMCVRGLDAKSCDRLTSCSCKSSDGIMDLAPSAVHGIKYKDVKAPDASLYSYNPCYSFDEPDSSFPPTSNNCNAVAACQLVPGLGAVYYDIGTQGSASFSYVDGGTVDQPSLGEVLTVTYTAGDNQRQSTVVLQCDPKEDFIALGEVPGSNPPLYIFVYTSPQACVMATGISPGSVLIIVFVCLIVVYLIGGVIFNKLHKHNSGLDLLPQRQLWVSLPGLVKDGVFFVIKRGQYHPIKG